MPVHEQGVQCWFLSAPREMKFYWDFPNNSVNVECTSWSLLPVLHCFPLLWYLAPSYSTGGSKGFLCHTSDSQWARIRKQVFLSAEHSGHAGSLHFWQICVSVGLFQPSLKSCLFRCRYAWHVPSWKCCCKLLFCNKSFHVISGFGAPKL